MENYILKKGVIKLNQIGIFPDFDYEDLEKKAKANKLRGDNRLLSALLMILVAKDLLNHTYQKIDGDKIIEATILADNYPSYQLKLVTPDWQFEKFVANNDLVSTTNYDEVCYQNLIDAPLTYIDCISAIKYMIDNYRFKNYRELIANKTIEEIEDYELKRDLLLPLEKWGNLDNNLDFVHFINNIEPAQALVKTKRGSKFLVILNDNIFR